MTIGDRIKTLRKQKGISVEKLAEIIGKDRATIYRYESMDIESMPTSVLEPLASALGTTPSFLMGWDDAPPSPEDEELQEYLEELKNRSEMRMLFKTAKNSTKEDIEKTVKIIEALRGQSE